MTEMNTLPQPTAVVMGLSPTGLHVVRSLGRAGVKVIGFAEGFQAGRASRYLSHSVTVTDPSTKLTALEALAAEIPSGQPGRAVLIPTSDQDVDFIIKHADRLARRFSFQTSYLDGLAARILSKDSFYDLCEQHGVAYPKLYETTREELAGLASKLRFPVMVKPARIHAIKEQMGGQKGWTVNSVEALKAVINSIPRASGTLLVQEIVSGPESAITLGCLHIDANGRMCQFFTGRKLRQFPPGFGSASLVQSSPEPDTMQILGEFLSKIGYHGIAAGEFKRDPQTNKLKIIEINVRPSLWFSITSAAGRDVVLAAYREMADLAPEPVERPQLDGVRWRYWAKDLWSALFYRRNPKFLLEAPDLKAVGPEGRRVWAVFSLDDPMPVFAEVLNFARKASKRLLQRSGYKK